MNFLYLSRIPLGKFSTIIGSTCWTLWQTFCLANVTHWVNRCPHPSQHLLSDLQYYVGCCYPPHVGFDLLVGRWCSVIAFRNHPSLHYWRCTIYSFLPLLGCVRVKHSPWRECFFVFNMVTHIVLEYISLGYLKWWPLWAMNYKFIPILTGISH